LRSQRLVLRVELSLCGLQRCGLALGCLQARSHLFQRIAQPRLGSVWFLCKTGHRGAEDEKGKH
jgi:hypothetical protein